MSASKLTAYLDSIPVNEVDFSVIENGLYPGEYTVALPAGAMAAYKSVSVTVTIDSGRAQAIIIESPDSIAESEDFKDLTLRVVKEQSLMVDGVSGATITSKAFFKAVENAVSAGEE
jgi:uncharacterized protein with FMN-binding domain